MATVHPSNTNIRNHNRNRNASNTNDTNSNSNSDADEVPLHEQEFSNKEYIAKLDSGEFLLVHKKHFSGAEAEIWDVMKVIARKTENGKHERTSKVKCTYNTICNAIYGYDTSK